MNQDNSINYTNKNKSILTSYICYSLVDHSIITVDHSDLQVEPPHPLIPNSTSTVTIEVLGRVHNKWYYLSRTEIVDVNGEYYTIIYHIDITTNQVNRYGLYEFSRSRLYCGGIFGGDKMVLYDFNQDKDTDEYITTSFIIIELNHWRDREYSVIFKSTSNNHPICYIKNGQLIYIGSSVYALDLEAGTSQNIINKLPLCEYSYRQVLTLPWNSRFDWYTWYKQGNNYQLFMHLSLTSNPVNVPQLPPYMAIHYINYERFVTRKHLTINNNILSVLIPIIIGYLPQCISQSDRHYSQYILPFPELYNNDGK